MAWTVLAIACRKDLCRLGGPHCCGVDGGRYRSPEGSLQGHDWPVIAPPRSGDGGRFLFFAYSFFGYSFFAYSFFFRRRLVTRFARNEPRLIVCLFSSHLFWTSSSLDVPAGAIQEEGHTGFLIHLPSAVHAFIFLARSILPCSFPPSTVKSIFVY